MDDTPQTPVTPSDNSGSTDAPFNPVVRRPITVGTPASSGSMDGVVRRSAVTPLQPEPPVETPQPPINDAPKTLDELDGPTTVTPEVPAPVAPQPAPFDSATSAPELPGQAEPAVVETPVASPTPVAPQPPITPSEPVAFSATPTAEESAPIEGSVVTPPMASAPKGRKGTGVAILIGVLFTVALIGGAGYAYWQNNKNKTPAAQTEQTTEEQKTVQPATADDIQKASDDIDAALNKVDDTKDFVESDLSDATLGL